MCRFSWSRGQRAIFTPGRVTVTQAGLKKCNAIKQVRVITMLMEREATSGIRS